MAYASIAGRARTSAKNPQAHGICDRCGFRYNFVDLKFQFDWRGADLKNLYLKVCERCYDTPQEQLRAIVLPPDPEPIIYARPEIYSEDSTDYFSLESSVKDPTTGIPVPSTTILTAEDGSPLIKQPTGPAPVTGRAISNQGLTPDAQAQLVKAIKLHQPIQFLSIMANGTYTVTVTCSAAHGLSANSQIAVQGASNGEACGFFSVAITNPMVFTYTTNQTIPSGSLIGSRTTMVTVNAGLPWNMVVVPSDGI